MGAKTPGHALRDDPCHRSQTPNAQHAPPVKWLKCKVKSAVINYEFNCSISLTMSLCVYSCGGRGTCSFQASNSLFGDLCVGTYKYLTVSYSCDWDPSLSNFLTFKSCCNVEYWGQSITNSPKMRYMNSNMIPRSYFACLKKFGFMDFGMLWRHCVSDFPNMVMLRPTLRLVPPSLSLIWPGSSEAPELELLLESALSCLRKS